MFHTSTKLVALSCLLAMSACKKATNATPKEAAATTGATATQDDGDKLCGALTQKYQTQATASDLSAQCGAAVSDALQQKADKATLIASVCKGINTTIAAADATTSADDLNKKCISDGMAVFGSH